MGHVRLQEAVAAAGAPFLFVEEKEQLKFQAAGIRAAAFYQVFVGTLLAPGSLRKKAP